jgi:hypothetical protein
MMNTSF